MNKIQTEKTFWLFSLTVRLPVAFNTSSESWMNQQSQYDLWQAEQHRNELQVSKLLVA